MCSESFHDAHQADCQHASTLVLQLHHESAPYASLVSAALLRDDVMGAYIPTRRSHLNFQLFGTHRVRFTVVRITPSLPSSGPALLVTHHTKVFLIPSLPPSLLPHALVPVLPPALTDGHQLPTLIHLALHPHPSLRRADLPAPTAVLVHAPHGHGKTSAVVSVAHSLQATVVRIPPSALLPHIATPRALVVLLNTYLSAAEAAYPSVLLIDDAQFVFPSDDSRRACVFPPFVDAVRSLSKPVALVLIVSPHISAVHPAVVSAVDTVLSLRLDPLGAFAVAVASAHSSLPPGMLQARLSRRHPHPSIAHVVEWARSQVVSPDETRDCADAPNLVEFEKSEQSESPSVESQLLEKWHAFSAKLPALDDALNALRRALLWPLLRKDAYTRLKVRPVRGVLLYGVPGTGKTAVVRAASAATGYSVVPVDAAMIAHGEVGAAEERLVQVYHRAKLQRPAVIFLDEVDALFGTARQHAGDSAASLHSLRLVGTLTRCLDAQLEGVVTIAATNRPWVVSRALLRPGRFEYCVRVPLPDSEQRAQIANVFADDMYLPPSERHCLVNLARNFRCAGFSGADIAGACRRAVMAALTKSQSISPQDLQDAFHSTVASVSAKDTHLIDTWRARGL